MPNTFSPTKFAYLEGSVSYGLSVVTSYRRYTANAST